MKYNTITKLLVILWVIHFLHIIEEIFGNAYFIQPIYGGLKWFLIINFSLLIIPLAFYLLIKNKKWFYALILIYAIIMILDGFEHIVELIIHRAFYEGGLVTSVVLIIIGSFLIKNIWQLRSKSGG